MSEHIDNIKAGMVGALERLIVAQTFSRFLGQAVTSLPIPNSDPECKCYVMADAAGHPIEGAPQKLDADSCEAEYYRQVPYHLDFNLLIQVYALFTTKRAFLSNKYGYGAVSGYDQYLLEVKSALCRAKLKEFYLALFHAVQWYEEVTNVEPIKSPFIEETDTEN